jgi:hypothetical protein
MTAIPSSFYEAARSYEREKQRANGASDEIIRKLAKAALRDTFKSLMIYKNDRCGFNESMLADQFFDDPRVIEITRAKFRKWSHEVSLFPVERLGDESHIASQIRIAKERIAQSAREFEAALLHSFKNPRVCEFHIAKSEFKDVMRSVLREGMNLETLRSELRNRGLSEQTVAKIDDWNRRFGASFSATFITH